MTLFLIKKYGITAQYMVFLSFLSLNLFLLRDTFGIMIKAIMVYYVTKQQLLTETMLGIMIPIYTRIT